MKVKNLISKLNHKNMKMNLAYEEWLNQFLKEPSELELNQMENDLISSNNPDYNPLKGA